MRLISAVTVAATLLLATPAFAVGPCRMHDVMVAELARSFKEYMQGQGVVSQAGVVELFVSEHGTWTVLVVRPNGWSCILLAGRNWETISPPPTEARD